MKRKKLLAGLTAAVMLCGAGMSLGVSAAVRDCDVNNDGSVNMLDVVTVNQFLMGAFYVADPAEMDANGNYIIDHADALCVQAQVINATYSWSFIDVLA